MTAPDKLAAIVTGGGRGIGKVIAEHLSQNYRILIVGRTEADLVATSAGIRERGGEAEYLVADVRLPSSGDEAMRKIASLGWDISVLVNNAGVGKSAPTHQLHADTWRDIISTNLDGSFYFSKSVLPVFVEHKKGTIVFVSSVAGLEGFSHEAAYVASKHAQVGLAKAIAKEYGKYGIVSAAICPGFVEGEMTERTIQGVMKRRKVSYAEALDIVASKNTQNELISPHHVARVVSDICIGSRRIENGQSVLIQGNV